MSIIKSFGTILNDNKHVRVQASRFKQTKKTFDKTLPISFNPFDQWGNYLSPIYTQGSCGCCWSCAATGAFADRLTIMTLGQFFEALSPYEMIMCQGAIPVRDKVDADYLKTINNQAHSQGACNGNSIYAALDFIYCFGLTTTRCVNEGEFEHYGIKRPENVTTEDIPMCSDVLGADYNTCLDREIATRFYRSIASYAVDHDIESIKQEIYKWGPVASGFNVFPDFLNEYDGISIYMGPTDKKAQTIGGHAIKILGWGSEEVNGEMVDFWWIANSWGTKWGRSGYFKMKMNITECQLEQNVVACIPDLPGFNLDFLLYKIVPDQSIEYARSFFKVEPLTGYKYTAIEKIKDGKLKGNLNSFICTHQPDFKTMWAGEQTIEDMEAFALSVRSYPSAYAWIYRLFILAIVCVVCFGIGKAVQYSLRHGKSR